ncbi:MAG: hypothetical protein IPN22_15705 [Bacteroidetes bacterium]|nr:hypothetical protein [Bacteroidota bacterium]
MHGDHGHAQFRGGRTTKTFTVQTTTDALYEGQRELHGQSQRRHRGATINATAGSATGTITDDDAVPVFSIANASATEGGQITFTVTRTGDAQAAQTVVLARRWARPARRTTATTGTLGFAAGGTTKTFTVQTTTDALYEGNEASRSISAPPPGAPRSTPPPVRRRAPSPTTTRCRCSASPTPARPKAARSPSR